MKKITFLLVLWVLAVPFYSYSQTKLLTATDAAYMNRAVFPATMRQLQWAGNSDEFVYVKNQNVYAQQIKKADPIVLFDLKTLNSDLKKAGFSALKRLPGMTFVTDQEVVFSSKKTYYQYDYKQHIVKKVNQVPDQGENMSLNKKNFMVAFTEDNNLYLAQDGKVTQITHDTNKADVNGQFVSRNEFGIEKGIFWSPNGNAIAFYRKDQTKVADYPLVDINHRIAKLEDIKYPMAGTSSEHVTLGVYDIKTGKTLFLDTDSGHFGKWDHYLTAVTWGPEGKYIYTGILNRGQNHMWLNQYDAQTGKFVKTLFEEIDPKYVEPLNPLYFDPFNPDQFIWISRRDGWNHLYLYNTEGKLIKKLTEGPWEVTEFLGYFPGHKVYYKATKESPLQQNVYATDMRNLNISRLTPDHGTHSVKISHDGRYLLDSYSSTDVSREYKLLSNKGKTIRVVQKDQNPLKDYKLGKMKIFTIPSPIDSVPLYCRMITPPNFDSSKKYPTIVYVYGGPHVQLITDSWLGGAGLFLNYMADHGYVIFTLDNHGSENRGKKFEQVIFRHLGTNEMKDQMAGVRYLKTLPFVDTTRLGVDGWSFGGFMTLSLMLRHPHTFKVAVAGGPVIDWKYYEVMYGERYMDTPQENPEGYKQASLLNYTQNIHGHILMIHGAVDPIVVWQHGLLFLQKAINEDKPLDYFVYPQQEHNMRGKPRIHLMNKIRTYFDDWL